MSSRRNAMIAILFFSSAFLHAVTLSSKFSYTKSQLNFTGEQILLARRNNNIVTKSPHLTPMEFASAAFQISGLYSPLLGIYAELGSDYALHGNQIFGSGSLNIKPHNFSPYLGIGAYYTSQNNAQLELGAKIAYLGYDLSNTGTGTLFNGYTVFTATALKTFPTDINFNITYPITDRMHSYVGLAYGMNFLNSELPSSEVMPNVYQSGLFAEPSGTTAAYIGDYYRTQYVDMKFNKISLGLKLNIKEF